MKQKLLELLNAKYLGKGTRKDTLARLAAAFSLQCTTEDEAQALVDKLTDEQVTEFEKEYRSEVDSEISKATKTALDKAGKGKGEEGKGEENKGGEQHTDIASIVANAIKEATTPLLQEINSIKAGKTSETRLQQLQEILKDVSPELKAKTLKDFDRMSFEDDQKFVEYLEETKTDIQEINQTITNSSLAGHQPLFGNKTPEGVSSAVKDFIQSSGSDSDSLTGKDI